MAEDIPGEYRKSKTGELRADMLSRSEFRKLDAVAMAKLVRHKKIKPSELLDAVFREIDIHNPQLNAIVSRYDELAYKAAASESPEMPLAGVPFPAKDINVQVKGMPLKHACRFLTTHRRRRRAVCWRNGGMKRGWLYLVVPIPRNLQPIMAANLNYMARPTIPGT